MGWASGQNSDGREVGYSVVAECDYDGCDKVIDRGLAYCCGGMHDGAEHGCGSYFCGEHLFYGAPAALCGECLALWEKKGRLVWISNDLYDHCSFAWKMSQPNAGDCEWAGDLAGAFEEAKQYPLIPVLRAVEKVYAEHGTPFTPPCSIETLVRTVLVTLGMPEDAEFV